MADNPTTDGSGGWIPPDVNRDMLFRDYGSYGLRQWGGWVREEFLPQLLGRQAVTVYREMYDNSATIGGMIFAILQSMRKMEWRVEPANDSASAKAEADFADSLRKDMSHTWEDFVVEALSMLHYGFSVHEIVYKRRLRNANKRRFSKLTDTRFVMPTAEDMTLPAPSEFNDGRIGWRRLPIRGQDTILKWFFDENGQIRGTTQQPWVGTLIDVPIEKMLLFRPFYHKNNPEGRSILRNGYRSYYLIKRLEELEAILFERMGGFPVMYVPSQLIDRAFAVDSNGKATDPQAALALAKYKQIVTNIRVDEQMGVVLPSDPYVDGEGKPTALRMYEFKLETPQHGRGSLEVDKTIMRHKVELMTTLLCDFLVMGHEVRGVNNLAVTKVDMFYQAIQGWLQSIAGVLNRHALPRLWVLNALDPNLMPQYIPELPTRLDLDSLGMFVANLAKAGMPLFPDEELQEFLRGAAGMPDITDPAAVAIVAAADTESVKAMIMSAVAKEIMKLRGRT